MKKQILTLVTASLMIAGLQTSCDNGDNPEPKPGSVEPNYVYSTIVGDNSFVGVIDDLQGVSQLNNSNSFVHAKSAYLFPYKDYLYVLEFESNEKLFQYRKTDGGGLALVKTLPLPAQSKPVYLTFKNDNEAYLSCMGQDKVLVIDPAELKITKEIDLSGYRLDEHCTVAPAASILRGDLLFVALWQLKSIYNPNVGAYMAVIDIRTNEKVKMISSQQATMAGNADNAGDPFLDEKGDMYVYCTAAFGYVPGLKDGFLRIKNGETEFDPTYSFPIAEMNIAGIAGNKADYVYQKIYMGNGKLYGYINVPEAASKPNPDYQNDKTMQPALIDIYNKTVEKVDLSASVGWSCCIDESDGKVVWGMVASEGSGLYLYDPGTKKVEKVIKTTGYPYRFFEFK